MTKSGNFRRPKPVNVEANKLCEKVTKISQKLTEFFASTYRPVRTLPEPYQNHASQPQHISRCF